MVLYILLFFIHLTTKLYAFKPLCSQCKFFIPHKNENPEYGFCKMFTNYHYTKEETIVMNDYARHCRKNDQQCGPNGYLFEPKNTEITMKKYIFNKKTEINNEISELQDKLKDLEEEICGEVNEKRDVERIDKERNILFKKIDNLKSKKYYTFEELNQDP
jgi:predicted RNase H-like nuclease (RuvC/YqgF family)